MQDQPWLNDDARSSADPQQQLGDPEYVKMKERLAALRAKGPIRVDESKAQQLS